MDRLQAELLGHDPAQAAHGPPPAQEHRHRQAESLPRIGCLVDDLGARLWSLFFLIPTGRGRIEDAPDAQATEDVLRWLHGFAATSRCDVRTTGAPQRNRLLAERGLPRPRMAQGRPDRVGRATRPVTDGDGFVFVSHKGEVYPSGFLPVVVGNVRSQPLSEIYRMAPELLALRDRSRLRGNCRSCEFREVCGGSRARAYAITGDYLESDPFCPHMPDPVAARRMIRVGVARLPAS